MINRSAQVVGIAVILAAAGVALFIALVWTRTIPIGQPHEIFGRAQYQRLPMPDAPPLPDPAGPELSLDDAAEEQVEGKDEDLDEAPSESRISFADRFGEVGMEVANPSWTDLTFDLRDIGNDDAAGQLTVAKEVTLGGRAVGSLRVHFGSDTTVLVDPDDLIALLANTSIDTSGLQALAGRNRVAFGTIREAGVDLRYRPAQDQLAIQQTERN